MAEKIQNRCQFNCNKFFQELKRIIKIKFWQYQGFQEKCDFCPTFKTNCARMEDMPGLKHFHLQLHMFYAFWPIFKKILRGTNFFYYCQLFAWFWPFLGKFFQSAGSKNDPNLTVLWHKMSLRMGERMKKSLLKNSHFCGF